MTEAQIAQGAATGASETSDPRRAAVRQDLPRALQISEALRRFVDFVGRFGSWMFMPLILITVMDVSIRKVGHFQIWMIEHFGRIFDSTVLQELEWHFHTALFALVLGYGYIWNTHVRVDLVRENLRFRKKAWLEFLGITAFLIPYCLIVTYFATIYVIDSYNMGEISASTVGLTHRWIIKTVFLTGMLVTVCAGIAVWLQTVILLWGPQDLRFELMTIEWPEEEGSKIEGKERLDLEKADDVLVKTAVELGHLEEEKAAALRAQEEAAIRALKEQAGTKK